MEELLKHREEINKINLAFEQKKIESLAKIATLSYKTTFDKL